MVEPHKFAFYLFMPSLMHTPFPQNVFLAGNSNAQQWSHITPHCCKKLPDPILGWTLMQHQQCNHSTFQIAAKGKLRRILSIAQISFGTHPLFSQSTFWDASLGFILNVFILFCLTQPAVCAIGVPHVCVL